MILVIDVGNTNITFGVYEGKKLVTTFRMTVSYTHLGKRSGIRRLSCGGNYGMAIFPYLICAAHAA